MGNIKSLRKRFKMPAAFPLIDGHVKISAIGFGSQHALLLETFEQLGIKYTSAGPHSYSTMLQYQIDEESFNLLVLAKKPSIVLAKKSDKGRIYTMIGKRPKNRNMWKIVL